MTKPKHNIARVTKTTPRHPSLSPDRLAVEACLKAATENLSAKTIARLTLVGNTQVSAVLQRMRHEGTAVNVGTGRAPAWRLARKEAAPASETAFRYPTETYKATELKPFNGRPGAMDAFALPSRGMKV